MPGDVNCTITKILIPFLERNVGPHAAEAICRAAGRSREYLMADHNWVSAALVDEILHLARQLCHEPDEERWLRRLYEFGMDWKPREERSYLGTYTMGAGDPRTLYLQADVWWRQVDRGRAVELIEVRRTAARLTMTPLPGHRAFRWACLWTRVCCERLPTNWGLPRATVNEVQCAAKGAPCCLIEVRWRNPSLGRRFWAATAAGVGGGALLVLAAAEAPSWASRAVVAPLAVAAGVGVGYGLRERHRRAHTRRLMDLQSEEILYSNNELEKKFRDLEAKIEQLSLLVDLSAAVNATLDVETIYEQALDRLVQRMGYQQARLWLVDPARRVLRLRRLTTGPETRASSDEPELRLDDRSSVTGKVATTGLPVVVDDVESGVEPVHLPMARGLGIRSLLAVPLRVRERVFGVLNVTSSEPNRFTASDIDLVSTVANHVALAVDRAESFRTIEELSRSLEEKVRVRTEQLRAANEELGAAYRDLQQTQMQLIQREKMASVGQLVAGVAHELNNPIGFVYSNVATLEDFAGRMRAMLTSYRARAGALPEADRTSLEGEWGARKIDYALKYLDSMTQGIREGSERARKIVRDLRVFARTGENVWQPVDLHEELESSLTLLNHLLKDRVTVDRKFGELPPVECVRSQVDQVFLNLLANAAQAIQGPGAITIETRLDGEMAVVAISDTGPGIPPEVIGRVFDPFFTTKPVGEGTGLGLSISYELMTKHGGDIGVTSRPGEGATFAVRIPLRRAA